METKTIRRTSERVNGHTVFCFTAVKRGPLSPDKGKSANSATVLARLSLAEILSASGASDDTAARFHSGFSRMAVSIQAGGWLSWSAAWELAGRERLPRGVRFIPKLNLFNDRQGERRERGEIVGHFIIYYRYGDEYICLASAEGNEAPGGANLPPLSYVLNRKTGLVRLEANAAGKDWAPDEAIARLHVFYSKGFFSLKDELRSIYEQTEKIGTYDFLGRRGGGYASWYNRYTDINETVLRTDLNALGATENLTALYFIKRQRPVVFQIDDGWQRAVGLWEPNQERFPNGLGKLAGDIAAKNFIPGLWLAPFLLTKKALSSGVSEDYLLRDDQGQAVSAGFNNVWDGVFYCLDLSRPEVLDELRRLMDRVIDDWGFRFIKLDFLYAGLLTGAFAMGGAAYEHYWRALRVLTERKTDATGRPVAYLGCGMHFGQSYRFLPLSRIGADTRESWDWPLAKALNHVGRPSALINLRDSLGRAFLHNSVYRNDPDVIFLRTNNCRLGETEKELIALVAFLFAGQLMLSDDPANICAEDVALTRRLIVIFDRLEDPDAKVLDEFGLTCIAADVFRVYARSGRFLGLINLRSRPFVLDKTADPRLAHAFDLGDVLIRRLEKRGSVYRFEPRSISLVLLQEVK